MVSRVGAVPRDILLTAVTGSREGDTQRIVVRAGQTVNVTMTSRGTATVAGRVLDFKDARRWPANAASVVTRQGHDVGVFYNGPDSFTISDADGRFVVEASAGEILSAAAAALAKPSRGLGKRTDVVMYMVRDSQRARRSMPS